MRLFPWLCSLLLCAASLAGAEPAATQKAPGPPPEELLPLLEQREAWREQLAEILAEDLQAMTRKNVSYATRAGTQRAQAAVVATRKKLKDLPKVDLVPALAIPPEFDHWGEFPAGVEVRFLRVVNGDAVLVEGPVDASVWQARGNLLTVKPQVRWVPFVVRGVDFAGWENGRMYHIPGTWLATRPEPLADADGIVNPAVLVPFDATPLDPWKNWRPKKPAKKPR